MGQLNASYELIIKSHKILYNTQGRFTDQRLQGGILGPPNEIFCSTTCGVCRVLVMSAVSHNAACCKQVF